MHVWGSRVQGTLRIFGNPRSIGGLSSGIITDSIRILCRKN